MAEQRHLLYCCTKRRVRTSCYFSSARNRALQWLAAKSSSRWMKFVAPYVQASNSSTDHGGGKRRADNPMLRGQIERRCAGRRATRRLQRPEDLAGNPRKLARPAVEHDGGRIRRSFCR